jgi:putative effector of murein hydrolase
MNTATTPLGISPGRSALCRVVALSGIGYARYFDQAAPLHNGLGVLIVLLAVLLVRQSALIRTTGFPLFIALFAGSSVATSTALAMGLGADPAFIASLAPKSATTAVAIGITERLGGLPGLTAMTAVLTGLCGATIGPWLLAAAGVRDERAAGFTLGVAAHATGTTRAFQISETAGAFASLGMILNAFLIVVLAHLAIDNLL